MEELALIVAAIYVQETFFGDSSNGSADGFEPSDPVLSAPCSQEQRLSTDVGLNRSPTPSPLRALYELQSDPKATAEPRTMHR